MKKFVNPSSRWKPYFDILPEIDELTSAQVFYAFEMKEVEEKPLMPQLLEMRASLRESYYNIFPALSTNQPQHFPSVSFSWENFLWARAIFDSRGFSMKIGGVIRNCLIPFVDMCNTCIYSQLDGRGYFCEKTQSFRLNALGTCQSGQQIFLNYGPYCNEELLLYYGITLKDNPYDCFSFELQLASDEEEDEEFSLLIKRKEALLKLFGLGLVHSIRKMNPLPPSLLGALRILSLSQDELKQIERHAPKTHEIDPREGQVSRENEERVLCGLKGILQTSLRTVETRVKQKESTNPRIRHARHYKQGLQEIIEFSLHAIEMKLKKL